MLPTGRAPLLQLSAEGLARFGDVSVAQGTGKLVPDPAGSDATAPAITLRIAVQLRQVPLAGAEQHPLAEGGWLTVWEKEIVFSDDGPYAARVAAMSQMQRKHVADVQVWRRVGAAPAHRITATLYLIASPCLRQCLIAQDQAISCPRTTCSTFCVVPTSHSRHF